jgi:solute carrier family 10 (sodium/bile acid cotransporter), member 7
LLQAYGNEALGLLLCVGSNLIGILTVPFYLKAILSSASDVRLDAIGLLIQLIICILVPLAIGKLLRDLVRPIKTFVTKHKTAFSLLNNGSLICIVWQSISRSQVRLHKYHVIFL